MCIRRYTSTVHELRIGSANRSWSTWTHKHQENFHRFHDRLKWRRKMSSCVNWADPATKVTKYSQTSALISFKAPSYWPADTCSFGSPALCRPLSPMMPPCYSYPSWHPPLLLLKDSTYATAIEVLEQGPNQECKAARKRQIQAVMAAARTIDITIDLGPWRSWIESRLGKESRRIQTLM